MNEIQRTIHLFLQEQFGDQVEKIQRLEGGMINYTYRLYFNNDSLPRSSILKFAFPSMSSDDNKIFPINRQDFEEKALNLFINRPNQWQNDISLVLDQNPYIMIPRVQFRDEKKHILIIDDCGEVIELQQWLCHRDCSSKSNIILSRQYGEQLATFLLDMQVASLPSINELEVHLHNEEIEQCILTYFVRTIGESLDLCEITGANELALVAIHHFEYYFSHMTNDVKVLAHGDLLPSSILINENRSKLAIIDWEFVNVLSPAWDLAFLLSYLHDALIHQPSDLCRLTFVHSFIDTYREKSKKQHVKWYEDEHEQYLFAWSLGIIHGTLLINQATTNRWCQCKETDCFHVRKILHLGAKYLHDCRSGANQSTYENISRDYFLGRFFHISIVD